MRLALAQFLKDNREDIRSLVDEADELTTDQIVVELGQFFDADFQLYWRTYGQSYVWNPTEARYDVSGIGGYDTMADVWPGAPSHFGYLHTHPNRPGMDRLSEPDLALLGRSDVVIMLAATRAGGRYQVVAQWDEGINVSGTLVHRREERFDLYAQPTRIARWLAFVLDLEPWQLILADTNGDGKISIIDAWLAARKRN